MDADDVVRLRLRGQQLREPFAATAEDALENLLAVQAQEFPYARWTLAQRTAGGSAAGVERAVPADTVGRSDRAADPPGDGAGCPRNGQVRRRRGLRCELDVRLDSRHHPGDGPELNRVVAAYGRFLGIPAVRR